jgi:glycosyltransferase involved in cell wall biosynthesis
MKISVVTINLNRREELRRTLESLARQSDKEFELVVVDGGSTDGSLLELESYASIITRSTSERDQGIWDAWNKGIGIATGEVIALLNAGDEYHPDVIRTIREFYDSDPPNSDRTALTGRVLLVRDGTIVKAIGNRVRRNPRSSIGFAHPGMIATRRIYREVGLYERISIASDSDFILRCIKNGIEFRPTDFVVYMDNSGISQRAATKGYTQYTDALVRHGYCGKSTATFLRSTYWAYRTLGASSLLRAASPLAANMRHFGIRVMNIFQRLCFFRPVRRWALYCLGLRVHRSSFVSPWVTLYRRGNVRIGAGSVINREVLLDNRDAVTIGNGCSISYDVRIITAGHDVDSPYFEYYSRPVTLEDYVVLFAGVTVQPGSVLRRGVAVLPGSVISGDTVENGIYGGVPAKLVRLRASAPKHRFDYHRPFAL